MSSDSLIGTLREDLTGTRILFQNGIGFGGPFEGLRLCVALSYPSFDRGFEISDAEHSAMDALACDLGEQPLNSVLWQTAAQGHRTNPR
jgi:hypothetical protein